MLLLCIHSLSLLSYYLAISISHFDHLKVLSQLELSFAGMVGEVLFKNSEFSHLKIIGFEWLKLKKNNSSETACPNDLLVTSNMYVRSSTEFPHIIWIWQKNMTNRGILISNWFKFEKRSSQYIICNIYQVILESPTTNILDLVGGKKA